MELILKPALSKTEMDDAPPGKTLKILLLYDERGFVNSAMELLRDAAAKVPQNISLLCAIWDFDFITEPLLAKVAAREASAADMVVVVLRANEQLPDKVQAWLRLWIWAHPFFLLVGATSSPNWQYYDCAPAAIQSQVEVNGELGHIKLFTLGGGTNHGLAALKEQLASDVARQTLRRPSGAATIACPEHAAWAKELGRRSSCGSDRNKPPSPPPAIKAHFRL